MNEMKKIAGEDENMNQAIEYIEKFLKEEGTTLQDKIDYEKAKSYDEGIIETAKKMLQDGLNVNSIAKYTGLSINEIEELN